jgi:predicted PurR-regulated permease PerM
VTTGVAAAVAVALLLSWQAADVFLLIFAGLLLAIFLRALSDWLSAHSPLSVGWALATVLLALIGSLIAAGWLLAPGIADQVDQLSQKLPQAASKLEDRISRYEWGRIILREAPSAGELIPDRADALAKVTGVFSATLGALANFVIVLFVGLYLAAEPTLYFNGLMKLAPVGRRERAGEVLTAVGDALRWWLLGKVISMAVVGAFTTLGLWLLDVPLALTLGLIAALLTFIPNIGPILSAIPAVMLALMQSPTLALYVALLYLGIQTVESYLLTPLLQKRAVSLPPALTISAQVLLGVLLGGLGLALATPLTAASLVLVKMLYVGEAPDDQSTGGRREAR